MDNILITGDNIEQIATQIDTARNNIKLQALGEVNTFLGINIIVDYKHKKLHIHQNNYTQNILNKYNKRHLYPKNSPHTG